MRFVVRVGCLLLSLSLFVESLLMAQGRSRRVLGVVVQADRAPLDNAVAQLGANVYSCDRLETEQNGVLRVTVGASQLFLAASSLAALEDDGNEIQALFLGGTVGFSSPPSAGLALRIPAGIVRAAGGRAASGQVSYAGPQKLVLSAIQGDLTLDSGGELRTVPEGKSAEITVDGGLDDRCQDEATADQSSVKQPLVHRKIGFFLIMGAAAAVSSYFLWHTSSESDSKPSQ